ncbi:hypothetical protein B0H11DRAFT_1905813 [Mycena galericulata]|nr:hypothetical protein B0H11DRAFT_1905813 [Mycena galericulata]
MAQQFFWVNFVKGCKKEHWLPILICGTSKNMWNRPVVKNGVRSGLGFRTGSNLFEPEIIPTHQEQILWPVRPLDTPQCIFNWGMESKGPILAIGSNMFAQVRQNPKFAEPRTEPGVRFGFGLGSASVQNRTPATLSGANLVKSVLIHPQYWSAWHNSSSGLNFVKSCEKVHWTPILICGGTSKNMRNMLVVENGALLHG